MLVADESRGPRGVGQHQPATRPDIWNLHADPPAVRAAARAWRSLAGSAGTLADDVDGAAGRVPDWRGAGAEAYRAHRARLDAHLGEIARLAEEAAAALDGTAVALETIQEALTASLAGVGCRYVADDTALGGVVTFYPDDDADLTSIESAVAAARRGRADLDGRLRVAADALKKVRAGMLGIAPLGNAGEPAFALPPGTPGPDGVEVIRDGDRLVVDVGDGDDKVAYYVDPLTGMRVLNVNGRQYVIPSGVELTVLAGDGADTVTSSVPADGMVILGGAGNDDIRTGAGGQTVLAGLGDDTVLTGGGADRVYAGWGYDRVEGGDGDDKIHGGRGNDIVSGGAGNDLLDGDRGDDVLGTHDEDWRHPGHQPEDGNDRIYGSGGDDTVHAGAGDDAVDGGEGDDRLHGDGGNDRLAGSQGVDYLEGGAGDDTLSGGAGEDVLYGGEGADALDGGDDRDYLEGGRGDDQLSGGAGDDLLSGGRGHDVLHGGAGDDTAYTGQGHDSFIGDAGNDKVYGQTSGPDGDCLTAEQVTEVAYDPRAGAEIEIEGSPEFRSRVGDDLDMLRSSPAGTRMLGEVDRLINEETWRDGVHLKESTTAGIDGQVSGFGKGGLTISVNPSTITQDYRLVPGVTLHHELAHVYDDGIGGVDHESLYRGLDNYAVPNSERQAVGLPIDRDGDGVPDDPHDHPGHPYVLTENALREEMRWPRRTEY
ncbi:hypothetical protein Sru01_18530 [Sphaerisporangium rufum]|uniref:Calcium-binding protein n=1 Tax=Sphaerisporangium rufum TaxID=1381558 RepID=A0A919UXC6_9ACTN|nr:M91 family zinc metallopeptidase [Sphaerisporangium rufum]GII76871.1 hypothetical protein Sru01_18530 [Sphaerisporangium rufum]